MVEAIGSESLITGIKVARDAPIISHLKFADDTFIFCEVNGGHIKNVKAN